MLCFQTEALSNPMLAALLDDKTGFVELFLQNGLSLREFLTPQVLCQLYTGVRSLTTDSLLFSEYESTSVLSRVPFADWLRYSVSFL